MIWEPIILSLKISFLSTLLTLGIGVLLARLFTKYQFKGKDLLETFILLPMVLPPSVVGYGLLILIGKRGLIGKILYHTFGITLVFHWTAACIAALIVSLPLMYQSCKAAFLNVGQDYEEAAMDLGADEKKVFWRITLPLARSGIFSGIILSFARALGEFGATLMVAGNIPGKTQTIPLAIYFAAESGDKETANLLMLIAVVFSFAVIYGLNSNIKKKG
ncbi:molybdate ABC transporter permease subunit [Thermotalea metallivorans]|uniref:Molybdenum transport system permease n=1 Tax=Thermotalea metallivorans TaxID=520762 RepID=A0A140LCG6_9FIRM|nr:molybdate ABC transporter permease subunit [Thermotalea metallivorans]KXG78241.1 Molybdenum transport system permease protein ModB [Thermotalea metallivorans]